MTNKSIKLDDVSDDVFAIVARELATGKPDDALWTKAFAMQNGNEAATKAQYIRLRVERLAAHGREIRETDDAPKELPPAPAAPQDAAVPELKPRPWARFWARSMDYVLWGVVFGFLEGTFLPGNKALADPLIFASFVGASWVIVETVLLGLLGSTPGKWLFNVRLNKVGNSLQSASFEQLFARSFRVWALGIGFGLPLIWLICPIAGYLRLKRNGITSWDEKGGFVVHHEGAKALAWTVVVPLIVLASFAGLVWQMVEKNRLREHEKQAALSQRSEQPTPPNPFDQFDDPKYKLGQAAANPAPQLVPLTGQLDDPASTPRANSSGMFDDLIPNKTGQTTQGDGVRRMTAEEFLDKYAPR